MGLVKTVQLAITGDIRDATSKIDVLSAKKDELTAEPVDLKAKLTGSEEVKAKLDDIDAHAELLKREFPEFTAKIDTSAATSKLAAIRKDLMSLTRGAGGGGSGAGLLGAAGGAAGDAGGAGSAAGEGGFLAGIGDPPAVALLGGAIVALLPELTALTSGFAAAATGLGAFAVLALPAISKVRGALHDTGAELAKLSPDERGAVEGIRGLAGEFTKMSLAFEPDVFKVFNTGLGVANKLLPDVKPFADAGAGAVNGLLKQFSNFASSAGFKAWLAQFQKLAGPSITAIGVGFGHIGASLGKLLTIMSAKDVVKGIDIAFSVLNGTIIGLTAYIKLMMDTFDGLVMIFKDVRHGLAALGDDFRTYFGRIGQDLATGQRNVLQWSADINHAIGGVISWFGKLPGQIAHALSGLGSLLFNIGKNAVQSLINGLTSLWGKLTSIVGHIKSFLGFGGGGGSGGKLPNVNVGLGGSAAANARLAQQMVPAWGSGANWAAWNYVGTRESGWNNHALNASSGAYGIPQALPPTKMPFAAQAAGGSSPAAQIGWMVNYMRGRYGGPQGAAAHEQAFNWYDSGVQMLPPGLSLAMNGTGRPERVGGEDLAPLLRRVVALLERNPQATGHALAEGLQGTARRAGARGMYSARGAWA